MTELITSGTELMFVGMGIVFLFLIMLVVAINIMSALVQRFFPEMPVSKTVPGITTDIDKSVVAAITAAVHQYRNNRKDAGGTTPRMGEVELRREQQSRAPTVGALGDAGAVAEKHN